MKVYWAHLLKETEEEVKEEVKNLIFWDLISDESHCDVKDYPINEDIDSFLNNYWPLPIDPETVECGKRFEVKGEGNIVLFRCGEYGQEFDSEFEGSLTMEHTDKEEC